MSKLSWEQCLSGTQYPHAQSWLAMQDHLGLAPNTLVAYARALHQYSIFCHEHEIDPDQATREHIALYVNDLRNRTNIIQVKRGVPASEARLSSATIQQRITAIRLYYAYLVEEGIREQNPVSHGHYAAHNPTGSKRGLIRHYYALPWIPTDEQWQSILQAAKQEPLRNRLMLALAYDAALRREELCSLATDDIDPSYRLLRIRAETTKNRRERVLPFSKDTNLLYAAYLQERRQLSRKRGPLFLSESRRNRAQPISIWTWSKVVIGIARRAGVEQFTTHTTRHLCLTDLARDGWDIYDIALFAGHQSIETTLLYIHRSGRDLAAKLEQGMAEIHAWRAAKMGEVLL